MPPRQIWCYSASSALTGLCFARESGGCLVWDENHNLHLLDRAGMLCCQFQCPARIACAAAADDGSAFAAASMDGTLRWFGRDLKLRWERPLPHSARALALDPFGRYLAFSNRTGGLEVVDRHGTAVWQAATARPLLQLAFVPESPHLLGAADFGLIACHDSAGQCVWRDAPVAHVGAMTLTGDGSRICFACYSDGLRCYALDGTKLSRLGPPISCRLASISHGGHHLLLADTSNRLHLLDGEGKSVLTYVPEKAPVALAVDALGQWAMIAMMDGRIVCLEL